MKARAQSGEVAGGHITNTASMASFIGSGTPGIYNTSKFAVRGLSYSLRHSMYQYGIGVSCVHPGLVKSYIYASDDVRPDDEQCTDRGGVSHGVLFAGVGGWQRWRGERQPSLVVGPRRGPRHRSRGRAAASASLSQEACVGVRPCGRRAPGRLVRAGPDPAATGVWLDGRSRRRVDRCSAARGGARRPALAAGHHGTGR